MIAFIVWIVVGGLVGWFASRILNRDGGEGAILDVLVGVVGASLGGTVFRLCGVSSADINDDGFTIYGVVVAFIGAGILVGAVKMMRRAFLT